MSPDPEPPDTSHATDADIDTGAPVRELADLRESPGSGFLKRIRSSIDRRRLGSDLTELGWRGVLAVLLEFIDLAIQLVGGKSTDGRRR